MGGRVGDEVGEEHLEGHDYELAEILGLVRSGHERRGERKSASDAGPGDVCPSGFEMEK